jgi:hypothetical protein
MWLDLISEFKSLNWFDLTMIGIKWMSLLTCSFTDYVHPFFFYLYFVPVVWQLNRSTMGKEKTLINIMAICHVDSGKVTTIGHLVWEGSHWDPPSLHVHSWSEADATMVYLLFIISMLFLRVIFSSMYLFIISAMFLAFLWTMRKFGNLHEDLNSCSTASYRSCI